MGLSTTRQLLLAIMLISSLLLGSALIHQYLWNPYLSAFCLAQKLLLGMLIILGFMGGVCGFCRFSGVGIILLGLVGAQLSFEQLYFQQASQAMMPGCLPPLGYLVDVLPLTELVVTVFSINGECAGIHPVIVGVSMPIWSLGLFVVVSLLGGWAAFSKEKTIVNFARQVVLIHEKKQNEP